eukprot:g10233.t1 g10233   contig4:1485403-1485814(-)
MDFNTIRKKICEGDILSAEDYYKDTMLVFQNARKVKQSKQHPVNQAANSLNSPLRMTVPSAVRELEETTSTFLSLKCDLRTWRWVNALILLIRPGQSLLLLKRSTNTFPVP